MNTKPLFPRETTATFSPCRTWRYTLRRVWDTDLPILVFVMLNPSKANELDNDPTVERCERRAVRLGYGGIIVVNVFAYVSTDRSVLSRVADPIGPDNDAAILAAVQEGGLVICAWGNDGRLKGRSAQVRDMLAEFQDKARALRVTKLGEPEHPLYVAYSITPQQYGVAP